MKKLILYTAVILINIFYSHVGFSYDLKVKNFNYVASNILEFDIYIKGPSPQYYMTGQYAFNFNPAFANGGNLTFTKRNVGYISTDIPQAMRPACVGVYGSELRLTPNLPNGNNSGFPFEISTTGDGSKVIRVRLTTTACAFAGNLNLTWRNSTDGGFYTKVYDAEIEEWFPGEPENGYHFISFTNITNSAGYTIDPIPVNPANVLVSPGCQTFLNLGAAFNAINTNTGGIYTNQNVTVSILNNTVEPLIPVLISTPFTTCKISPANNAITVTAAAGVTDLVILDGTKNVEIDGRVGAAGTSQLTFINTNSGAANSNIKIFHGATDNMIRYVRCDGFAGKTINIDQTTTSVNTVNTVEHSMINKGSTGISCRGVYGAYTNSVIIKNNIVKNCTEYGVLLDAGTQGCTVENNELKNDAATTLSADYTAIDCKGEGINSILQNKVDADLINTGNNNYYGIRLSSGSGNSVYNVCNNFIKILQNNLNNIRGIFTTGDASMTANIFHNTVYLDGGGIGETFGIFANMNANYHQKNNISINRRSGNGSNSAVKIVTTANENLDIDYNCYWADHSNVNCATWNLENVSRHIPKYQCIAFPNEKNSIFKNVTFVDQFTGNLNLDATSKGDYDLIGTPIVTVTTDIEGNSRNANVPYMGADESDAYTFDGTIKIRAYLDNYRYPQTGTFDIEVWECNSAGRTLGLLGNYPGTVFNSNGIMKIDCPAAKTIPPTNKFYIVLKHQYAIETWSKDLGETFTTVPGNYLEYNFTSGADKAFAYNMKTCCNKAYVFYGDTNEDGYIEFTYDIFDTWVASLPTPSTDPKFDMDFNLPVPTNMTDVKIVQESNTWFPVIVTDPTINGAYTNRPGEASNSYEVDYLAPDPNNTCDCNTVQN